MQANPSIWEQVQAKLAENLQGHRSGAYVRQASLLAGKVEDEHGTPLACEHASKTSASGGAGRTRYRYYVGKQASGDGVRIPARELETIVLEQVTSLLADPLRLASCAALQLDPDTLRRVHDRAETHSAKVRDRQFMSRLIGRVRVLPNAIEVICNIAALAEVLGTPPAEGAIITLKSSARITRTGRVVKLVDAGGAPLIAAPDTSLLRLIAKAHRWWVELRKGELDISSLSARENVKPSYMTRVLRLAFLSPQVTAALLKGWQSTAATVSELTLGAGVPARWDEQARVLVVKPR